MCFGLFFLARHWIFKPFHRVICPTGQTNLGPMGSNGTGRWVYAWVNTWNCPLIPPIKQYFKYCSCGNQNIEVRVIRSLSRGMMRSQQMSRHDHSRCAQWTPCSKYDTCKPRQMDIQNGLWSSLGWISEARNVFVAGLLRFFLVLD